MVLAEAQVASEEGRMVGQIVEEHTFQNRRRRDNLMYHRNNRDISY